MRYPVSFAQRRLLALDRRSPAASAAHLPYAIRLEGAVDRGALQRAVDLLVARHATLRTVVAPSPVRPEQVVEDTGDIAVEHVVLTDCHAESFALEVSARPFDLARGPLLRVSLVETGPARSLLVLVAHRVVADEAGLAVLLDEMSTLYRDPAAVLPQLWMDYGDYAVWQLDRLRGEELARQLEHWRTRLRDAPRGLAMLTDRPRRDVRSTRGGVATAVIDPDAVAGLTELAGAVGTDLSMAVLAGYAVVLSRCARQRDVVIGLPVDGRVRPELVPIVGPFSDTVPVRVSADDVTFAELLDQVRRVSSEARSHAELPYELLAAELGLAVPPARFGGPAALPAPDFPGVTAGSRIAFPTTTESDLDLVASDGGTLTLGYRTDLVDPPLATRVLRSVVAVVERAARVPGLPIADLPVWSAGDSVAPTTALPAPHRDVPPGPERSAEADDDRVGRNPVEADMVGIWAELLHTTDPIGVHDNLFGLGGGSLTAMRFAARIADAYGVSLSMHSIVAAPTISQLAEIVSAAATAAGTPAAEPDADLAALSDEELDDLLRAVLADRDRRQGGRQGGKGDGR